VNTHVPECVDFAFHALALHERRKNFSPDLWESYEPAKTTFKQCWFLGTHSDVGGGNKDSGLASISLLWMLSELTSATGAEFAMNTVMEVVNPVEWNWSRRKGASKTQSEWDVGIKLGAGCFFGMSKSITFHRHQSEAQSKPTAVTGMSEKRSFSALINIWFINRLSGDVSNSMKGVFVLAGSRLRRPGRSDLTKAPSSESRVTKTNIGNYTLTRSYKPWTSVSHTACSSEVDTVHFTVRVLLASRGLECPALKPYETRYENERLMWCSKAVALDPKPKFTRMLGLRSARKQDVVTMREHRSLPSEMELLRTCFQASEFNSEDNLSPRIPPESSDGTMPLGRTQLAQHLLPLLSEAWNPTLHYPPSLLPTQ
jgi:hypothetical protein